MTLTPLSFLIVCPLLFLAGFVDSIGGGGGLISLPAYLLAGLPVHQAIATNKLSSSCGTTLSTVRFLRHGLINLKLAVPSVIAAFVGSSLGARLSLLVSEDVMKYILFAVLPVAAFFVLNRHLFQDRGREAVADRRTTVICVISALLIGAYDGFYGPGTGTFLINGQVMLPLGLAAALCNMAGNWLGSGLAMTRGTKIVRPVILGVLLLLFLKIIIGF